MKVLVVCLGNICRSPTGEGVLRAFAADEGVDVDVDSAGTGHWHVGQAPDPRTIAHAKRRGFDLSTLRARQVEVRDFTTFDLVLAMDGNNLRDLRALCPAVHHHKLALFLDVLGEPARDVPDPYHGDADGFEHVLDLVEQASRAWIARWRTSAVA